MFTCCGPLHRLLSVIAFPAFIALKQKSTEVCDLKHATRLRTTTPKTDAVQETDEPSFLSLAEVSILMWRRLLDPPGGALERHTLILQQKKTNENDGCSHHNTSMLSCSTKVKGCITCVTR